MGTLSIEGETGMCSMSTEAIVLACDVRLEPGEKKTCKYTRLDYHLSIVTSVFFELMSKDPFFN